MGDYQKDLNGVWIWNPMPAEGETVLWQGPQSEGYASGRGRLTWFLNGKEISHYEGDMLSGKPHGSGSYLFADGDRYEGEWAHGLRQGYGKQWYRDGSFYEGEWSQDKRK